MEYAVIRTGGKQYRVSPGDILEIDKLPVKKDETVVFDDVLLWVSGDPSAGLRLRGRSDSRSSGQAGRQVKIGMPVVGNVKVKAKVLEQKKGEKIRVAKFKSKVRYRRVMGFRSLLTKIKIEKIIFTP